MQAATLSDDLDRPENTKYHLSQLRKSAQEIAEYVCSLSKAQLQEFWLPCKSSQNNAPLSFPDARQIHHITSS